MVGLAGGLGIGIVPVLSASGAGPASAVHPSGSQQKVNQTQSGASQNGASRTTGGAVHAAALPTPPVVATGSWHLEAPLNGNAFEWNEASCLKGTETCWIVGGFFDATANVSKTTNGGSTWVNQTPAVPSTQGGLHGASCATASNCVAGGATFNVTLDTEVASMIGTSNGGASWVQQQLPAAITSSGSRVDEVACATASNCEAVIDANGEIVGTTNGGASWVAQDAQAGHSTQELHGIACPTANNCFAVGAAGTILHTSNGGGTWTAQVSPNANQYNSVSCPDITHCFAVTSSGDIVHTTDGSTWTAQTSGTATGLNRVSCPDDSHCVVVGNNGIVLRTTNAGTLWGNASLAVSVELDGVSCSSDTHCVAGNRALDHSPNVPASAFVSTNGGSTWTQHLAAQPVNRIGGFGSNGISCPGPATCFAAAASGPQPGASGGGVLLRTTDGINWNQIYYGGPGSQPLHAISCADTMHCVAVGGVERSSQTGGQRSIVLTTVNGGASWTRNTSLGTHAFLGVACTSTSTCIAVGENGTIIKTTNGGTSWAPETSGTTNPLWDISCPDSSHCYATTGNNDSVLATVNGGTTWVNQPTPGNTSAISCHDDTHCVAVGGRGSIATTANGGTTWTDHSVAVPTHEVWDIWGVSCVSDTTCTASGGTGSDATFHPALLLTTTNGGASWSQIKAPLGEHGTTSIACTSLGCWAGGKQDAIVSDFVPPPTAPGYWMDASDGGVFQFGAAKFFGSLGNIHLNQPIVGMAVTPSGHGYYLVASDGGVFNFGDAKFLGSLGNIHLNKPIVGMAVTPSGKGYYLVGSDGGVFQFGDAKFHGSLGSIPLNKPIVGMAVTPSGGGYYLVASDGGLFQFGTAPFDGSLGSVHLNKPIVGMAVTPSGNGYYMAASDGGLFQFGLAPFDGSLGNITLNKPVVGMAVTPSGNGYYMVASDGGLFQFGKAPFLGSLGNITLNKPIVGMAVKPFGA